MRTLTMTMGVAIIAAFVAAGCGKADAAKQQALVQFEELRTADMGGQEAAEKARQMSETLHAVELTYADIGTSETEIQRLIEAGWQRTARANLRELMGTKASPERAKQLREGFETARWRSGRPVAFFETSDAVLNQQVARNGLEFAQRQGTPITNAMYRAAGIPVPVEVRTRTVTRTVIRPAPPARTARAAPAPRRPPARRAGG